MAKYVVKQSGPLRGEVFISGAKNAVLPLMAAALLAEEECIIRDVPMLRDVAFMKEILTSHGAEVTELEENVLAIETNDITSTEAKFELVNKMRASILIMGPLLARKGKARIPLPGGCAIGARPIDLHLKGLEALGAVITVNNEEGYVEAVAGPQGLIGDMIYLDFPSVGATENIMMAAVLAQGTTYLENAAEEPEIVDLANFLNKMGAKIKGAGTDTIKIEGVDKLHGAKHTVIPDRIEAGTFMLAAAITRGAIHITNVVPDHLKPIIAKLRECGVRIEVGDEEMIVRGDLGPHTATDIKTLPYPGFPTDAQSLFLTLLSRAHGESILCETVFENRFQMIPYLKKMGADIDTVAKCAYINGVTKLHGETVQATDLRSGAAILLAGAMAEGETIVQQAENILRGYENPIQNMRNIGLCVH